MFSSEPFARLVSASGNSPQVEQFFDRLATLPSPTDQAAYASFINGLVPDGTWVGLKAFSVLGGPDAATSLTELTSGTFMPSLDVATGVPTFTEYRGWTGFAAPTFQDINANFNPALNGGSTWQNFSTIGALNLSAVQINAPLWRDFSDTDIELWPLYSNTNTYTQMNDGTEVGTITGIPDGSGSWSVSRTASNLYTVKRNDVLLASPTTASRTPVNSSIYFGGSSNILFAIWIGALTSSQETTLFNGLHALAHGWGAV